MLRRNATLGVLLTLPALAACGRGPNPILGKWVVNGKQPSALAGGITALDFGDHTVKITQRTFRPFAMLANKPTTTLETESDPYDVLAANRIRITSGSQAIEVNVQVKDGNLYWTPVAPSTGNAQMDAMATATATTMVFARPK